MTGKRIKDFYRFVRSVESFTDGQVSVVDWDETELTEINVQVQPNDGPYEGGRFHFTIKMGKEFPESGPEVNCKTEIYHPNIDPTSEEYNVCLSLFDEWTSKYGLRDVIQGLLFLFYNPNVEDPLSSYFGDTLSEEEFEENVRASLRGEDIDDYSFPWNYYGNDAEMLAAKPGPGVAAKQTADTNTETNTEESNTTEPAAENLPQDVEIAQEATEGNVGPEVKKIDCEETTTEKEETTRNVEVTTEKIETRNVEVTTEKIDTEVKETTGQNEESEKVEETRTDEVDGEVVKTTENGEGATENVNEVTENVKETTENVSVEVEETRTETSTQEAAETPEVETEVKVLDIAVVLEKVTELMAQHNINDNDDEEEEGEDGDASAETENETTDGNAANEENAEATNCDSTTEIRQTGAGECNEVRTENVNVNTADASPATANATPANADGMEAPVHPLQRQSSKVERTSDVIEAVGCADQQVTSARDSHTAANCAVSSGNPEDLSDCIDAFRACSFGAPDFDHAINMFGAACYFVYKSYVR